MLDLVMSGAFAVLVLFYIYVLWTDPHLCDGGYGRTPLRWPWQS
jgi:hypothetical protein